MAVEACSKPNFYDDDDDDDGPVVFKRSNTASKQKQLNLEVKKPPSHRQDEPSGKQVSGESNTSSKQKQLSSEIKKPSSLKQDELSGRQVSGVKPDEDSEDEWPVVFKKSNTSIKQKQVNSEMKGRVSNVNSPNVQNSSSQKGKVIPSTKTPPVKSPIANPKAPTSLPKTLPLKSPVTSSKASPSSAVQSKDSSHLNKQNTPTVVKDEKPSLSDHDSDSEDDKPLSSRVSAGLPKGNSTPAPAPPKVDVKKCEDSGNEIPSSSRLQLKSNTRAPPPPPKVDVKNEDSDDDNVPLSSRLQSKPNTGAPPPPKGDVKNEDSDDEAPLSSRPKLKPNTGASSSKSYDPDGKKHLASKHHQNGSSKTVTVLNKRPLSEASSSDPSSIKKAKLFEASTSTKIKQVSVKEELKMKPEPKAEDDDDHIPLAQRTKKVVTSDGKSPSAKPKLNKVVPSTSFKKTVQKSKTVVKNSKYSKSTKALPNSGDGQKWTTLVHSGVIFPPPYKSHGIKMLYNGQPVDLTPEQEEVATMFAVMKDTEYAEKPKFLENFMTDWRRILGKNHVIKDFKLCDFTPIYEWHQREKEKKKQMTSEEKKAVKEEKLKQEEKYMWAIVDGVKEKVGNFRVEPPGLFRGRGEHPKMGKLKRRIRPSDITINIGKGAPIPECPIPGESWKEVKHDNTVTWLAFWNDPINPKEFKYVFLAASSSLKGQSDKEKYEKARLLKDYIHGIRATYTKDFASKDLSKRQIAVATYLIDKLALRAGNEKDDDEADTVGCCTLKVENVELVPPNKLQFDFLGKDSIRYFNTVEVEVPVYKAIGQFKTGKKDGEDLFDKLDTSKLNAHLKELMPGLTAKVFRTYNASITLDEMLNKDTKDGDVGEKIVVYQHANKEVAIICNHQRSVSKSHSAQMTRLTEKMDELQRLLDELKTDLSRAKKGKPPLKDADGKQKRNLTPEALEKKIAQTNAKIEKMERDMKSKEDLKTVALGTSKINYLDPRISVAWCKRHEVPIEKIFNKSLLAKFAWAMDVDPSFRF